ncbi:DUF202 domain-containing protein [Ramlibacter sp. USB13]|uniref:DUF202 domain-containing protein n=1 Tax=Ramlibacter cellulosilyticus TaxID=2764187 RepID=A0A923MQ73_9BURK|nr:DUF202 domain-containing protein [Ramlibacter cellulosilyticus]MBC5783195.1 DUF202 domain-containing protein [Ramlibacter cellulosilyticus]
MALTRDPGLQPERTELAWGRTSLVMAAHALVVVRAGTQSGEPALLLLGIVVAVLAIGLLAAGQVRRRQLARSVAAPSARLMAFAAGSVVFASAVAVLAIVR